MTAIQVTGIRWRRSQYQLGAGILSVMGISFASVPLFTSVISQQMVRGGIALECAPPHRGHPHPHRPHLLLCGPARPPAPSKQAKGVDFDVIFGQLLGTVLLMCIWPLFLSFLPYRVLKKLFPPIVTGACRASLCVGSTSVRHPSAHTHTAQRWPPNPNPTQRV
jgi:xanthine/uracil permease